MRIDNFLYTFQIYTVEFCGSGSALSTELKVPIPNHNVRNEKEVPWCLIFNSQMGSLLSSFFGPLRLPSDKQL